jgi:hypothetical protein
MSASRLEHSDFATHVATRNYTRTTDETSTDVGENATVEVGCHHDVELLRTRYTLHTGVVYNHIVCGEAGVFLADTLDGVAEKTIGELHNVGLVDTGDLLAVVGESKGKGELGNALRLRASDDLQRLDDAIDGGVLETRVFTFCVFTDDAEVDVLVAGLVAGNVLDEDDVGVNVELLTKSDIERDVTGACDWCV